MSRSAVSPKQARARSVGEDAERAGGVADPAEAVGCSGELAAQDPPGTDLVHSESVSELSPTRSFDSRLSFADEGVADDALEAVDDRPAAQEAQRVELQDRLGAFLRKGRARVIVTDNVHTMLSVKRGSGVLTFRLHHMFLDAPASVLREIVRYAETQSRDASLALRRFIDSRDELVRRDESARRLVLDVAGRHHNLQEIFDELNEEYFAGSVVARITWGPRVRRKKSRDTIKLGSYTVEDELIRIHPVLDAEDVPGFFVAWIVFHEMLHELHDMPVVDGRRVYHTREFRDAEARFEHYAEAVLWERLNVHRLLER